MSETIVASLTVYVLAGVFLGAMGIYPCIPNSKTILVLTTVVTRLG